MANMTKMNRYVMDNIFFRVFYICHFSFTSSSSSFSFRLTLFSLSPQYHPYACAYRDKRRVLISMDISALQPTLNSMNVYFV